MVQLGHLSYQPISQKFSKSLTRLKIIFSEISEISLLSLKKNAQQKLFQKLGATFSFPSGPTRISLQKNVDAHFQKPPAICSTCQWTFRPNPTSSIDNFVSQIKTWLGWKMNQSRIHQAKPKNGWDKGMFVFRIPDSNIAPNNFFISSDILQSSSRLSDEHLGDYMI